MSKTLWFKTAIVLACAATVLVVTKIEAAREAAINYSSGPAGLVVGQAIRLSAVNDAIDPNNPNTRAVPVTLTLLACREAANQPPIVLASKTVQLTPGQCASINTENVNVPFDQGRIHVWAMLAAGGIPGGGCIKPSLEVYDLQTGKTTAVIAISEEREAGKHD